MVAGDDLEGLYDVLVPEPFGDLALSEGARALAGTVDGDDLDGHVFAPEVAFERTGAPHGREAAAPDHLGQRVASLSFDVARLCHYLIGYCIAYQHAPANAFAGRHFSFSASQNFSLVRPRAPLRGGNDTRRIAERR